MAIRRKFTQTKLFRALIVCAVLLIVILFSPRFLLDPVRALFATVAWPVHSVFSGAAFGIRDVFGFFGSIGELKQENERLEKERLELISRNAGIKELVEENAILRREIGLLPRQDFELVSGEVMGRGDASGGLLLVGRGSAQGIAKGMPVIVGKGILVGRVTEVFPYSSTVMLLTHPESYINGMAQTSRALGIVKGEHGLGILLDMVLQSGTLTKGDAVIASGLDPGIPEGLLIGTLQEPGLTADRLYQRASVVPPVTFENLRYVFFIKNIRK